MNAEIIAVGTELLLGDILNTNAQYLARQLAGLGFTVWHQSVVGDNPQRLAQLAQQARQRSQLVIYSGGLGPTADDLTKETIAAAYGDTLRFDEEQYKRIADYFTASGRSVPANNRKQAMVPVHGRTLQNDNGTAPGVVFEQDSRMAILLPGPPKELVPMFEKQVRPLLETLQDGVLYSRILRVYGIGESRLEELVGHLLEGSNPPRSLSGSPPRGIPWSRPRPSAASWPMNFTGCWGTPSTTRARKAWRKPWCSSIPARGCSWPPPKAAPAAW